MPNERCDRMPFAALDGGVRRGLFDGQAVPSKPAGIIKVPEIRRRAGSGTGLCLPMKLVFMALISSSVPIYIKFIYRVNFQNDAGDEEFFVKLKI
ncbi:hypothetical protein [Pleomorphomonas carboxyditropha]|uniref:hypothetical protein n=1 Tax=Pleomorphomonas carboxyditropha TaxID=2023338 RepID=UPI001054CF9F|nr:hypothetical protein [Pleomorphomonas carboxyditropha]